MGRTIGQFVGLLLLIGVIGAYFWPIALTLAAFWVSYHVVLHWYPSDGDPQ